MGGRSLVTVTVISMLFETVFQCSSLHRGLQQKRAPMDWVHTEQGKMG